MLEHRHLSLRLRMSLTRVHALARMNSPRPARASCVSLLERFAANTPSEAAAAAAAPRRLPDALAAELNELPPLVSARRAKGSS